MAERRRRCVCIVCVRIVNTVMQGEQSLEHPGGPTRHRPIAHPIAVVDSPHVFSLTLFST
jgi:hypothetical protein